MPYNVCASEPIEVGIECCDTSLNTFLETSQRNLKDAISVLAAVVEVLTGKHPNLEDHPDCMSMLELAENIEVNSRACSDMANDIRNRLFGL